MANCYAVRQVTAAENVTGLPSQSSKLQPATVVQLLVLRALSRLGCQLQRMQRSPVYRRATHLLRPHVIAALAPADWTTRGFESRAYFVVGKLEP